MNMAHLHEAPPLPLRSLFFCAPGFPLSFMPRRSLLCLFLLLLQLRLCMFIEVHQ